jgi:hypothetical protein
MTDRLEAFDLGAQLNALAKQQRSLRYVLLMGRTLIQTDVFPLQYLMKTNRMLARKRMIIRDDDDKSIGCSRARR